MHEPSHPAFSTLTELLIRHPGPASSAGPERPRSRRGTILAPGWEPCSARRQHGNAIVSRQDSPDLAQPSEAAEGARMTFPSTPRREYQSGEFRQAWVAVRGAPPAMEAPSVLEERPGLPAKRGQDGEQREFANLDYLAKASQWISIGGSLIARSEVTATGEAMAQHKRGFFARTEAYGS